MSLRVKSVRNQHIYLQKKWDTFENSKFHDFPMTFCKSFTASNMNIHYDVTGLLTVVWRSEPPNYSYQTMYQMYQTIHCA